jgi:KDO2-lipid IV(A) lauroyltransferase
MFWILAFFLSNLPNFLENTVFELLYPVYLLKFKKEKKYIAERLKKANLKIKPKDVYKNLFLNGLACLKFLQNKKIPIKFAGTENLEPLHRIGKNPIVFASIHLGAFEILHRHIAKTAGGNFPWMPVNLIVSEFKNKKLDSFLTKIRTTANIKIVKAGAKTLNAIRDKEILAVMADQSKGNAEIFQILGDSVPLYLKLPIVANRLGASLVFFRTFKKNNEHIISFERVYAPKSQIDKNEIAKMLESWILEYPEQWAWNYSSK